MKPKVVYDHLTVGKIGEGIVAQYLVNKGHKIMATNYRRKWGEIDIVSRETTGITHFVEVKAVSYETMEDLKRAVSYGTYRPEEHVDRRKINNLSRVIESWLAEHDNRQDWKIDVVTVRMVPREKYALVNVIANLVLEL